MAKAKQPASSAKPARSARTRKRAAAGQKDGHLTPARPGRSAAKAPPPPTRGGTKQAQVIALLERDTGATLQELVAATGWLPHTTRAALAGLRHKGFRLDKSQRENGTTAYRISSAPASHGVQGG